MGGDIEQSVMCYEEYMVRQAGYLRRKPSGGHCGTVGTVWDACISYLSAWDGVLPLLLMQVAASAPERQQVPTTHVVDLDGISGFSLDQSWLLWASGE